MNRRMSTRAAYAVSVVVMAGCRREHAAESTQVGPSLVIACPSGERTIQAHELALDDALCGEPWTAWELETRQTVELVHRQPGRTLQLRARAGDAVVEVRAGTQVESTFHGVSRIQLHVPATPQAPERITLTRGNVTEQLTMAELAHRYPDARRQEIPLCALIDVGDVTATVSVVSGQGSASAPMTRAECEREGLLLHTSNRGGIQLRDRARQRLVDDVTGVVIAPGVKVGR